ncbi:MAG: hypothetical protein II304_14510 [Bacteroidales bacterium]|nr:hypothetical protein [Bacteroidales bacterium]
MKYFVGKSFWNSKHFTVNSNFNIEAFQTIRCKQGRKITPINGIYSFECTRLDVKIMRDNPVFKEVNTFNELITNN